MPLKSGGECLFCGRSDGDAAPTSARSWWQRHAATVVAVCVLALALIAYPTHSSGAAVPAASNTDALQSQRCWIICTPSLADPPGDARTRRPSRRVRAQLSHYGTKTDGTLGHRTACGRTVTFRSYWVAALKPRLASCGARLTLYYRGQRYHVTVQDRGAWRRDSRALDAAPGLKRAMGFRDLAQISYSRGWH